MISLVAVAVIVLGFAWATARYTARIGKGGPADNFRRFKIELGRSLTLGLEILVLSDVIETITVEPSFRSLSVLGFLVLIRTAVNWTLVLETEGRWPWQPPAQEAAGA